LCARSTDRAKVTDDEAVDAVLARAIATIPATMTRRIIEALFREISEDIWVGQIDTAGFVDQDVTPRSVNLNSPDGPYACSDGLRIGEVLIERARAAGLFPNQ
jgi:hypothetical protein